MLHYSFAIVFMSLLSQMKFTLVGADIMNVYHSNATQILSSVATTMAGDRVYQRILHRPHLLSVFMEIVLST